MNANKIIRECARQSYALDAERARGQHALDAVRAWRDEAADHGDTAVVEAIDSFASLEDAADVYRDAILALDASDGASTV